MTLNNSPQKMGSESVGSSNPILEFNKSQNQQFNGQVPILHNTGRDICFHCQKPGHWVANCPDKQNMKKTSDSPTAIGGVKVKPTVIGDQSIPDVPCPCGGGTCIVLISGTDTNPGRKFYKCPRPTSMKCNFFHWCDMTISDHWYGVPQTPPPMCPCGAGLCLRWTSSKYNGRPCFACPVKKGYGSCGFICWEDAVTKTLSSGLLDGNKHSPRLTSNGQETKRTHEGNKTGDGNKLKGITSPMEGRSDSTLIKECHVKEDMVRLDSMTLVSPVRNLILSEDNKTVPIATSGQCFSGSNQRRDTPETSYPMCPCGAGPCSPSIGTEGENKGRTYFVCPVKKGEGACSFFQWAVQESTNGIDEQKKHGDGDKGKGIVNPALKEEGSDSTLAREYLRKEEMVRLDSNSVMFSDLVSPVKNLKLSEEKKTVPAGKAGHCLWCGKEGHWSKECITMNPPCFRCGKSGHWMKDCTA